MAAEDNRTLMRRYYLEVWEKGDLAAADELVAEDLVDHMPGEEPGRAGHHATVQAIAHAFPDRRFTIDDLLTDGDKVAGLWTMHATHQGDLFGIPASGKPVAMRGIDIARWQDGKIVEVSHIEDIAGLLQQTGVVPGPGEPAA